MSHASRRAPAIHRKAAQDVARSHQPTPPRPPGPLWFRSTPSPGQGCAITVSPAGGTVVQTHGQTHGLQASLTRQGTGRRAGSTRSSTPTSSIAWERLGDWFHHGRTQQFGSIWAQISVTLQEAVLGFIIGSAAGVVFGILLGRARLLADVVALRQGRDAIPRIVLASLFVIWFGLGLSSKVATAVVLVFFAVFFNAFQGAREVDRTLVDNARILRAGKRQILTSIVLPSATSWITAACTPLSDSP